MNTAKLADDIRRALNEGAEDAPENASVTINIHSRPITSLKWVDKYAAYAGNSKFF
mgnify:CR=1 FL=1